MKKFLLLLFVAAMALPMTAQENKLWRDSWNINAHYGFETQSDYMDFNSATVSAGYRKFLYWGLFVMPEVSLHYQYYDATRTARVEGGSPSRVDCTIDRYGLGLDAMLGVRIPIAEKVGIDLMTGPYIGYSPIKTESWYLDKESLRDFEFRWRFGIGVSVLDKVSVSAYYDLVSDKLRKDDETTARSDIFSIGIGYTF